MQNNIKELYGVIAFLLMYEKETGSLYITKQLVYSNKNRSVLAISYTIHLSSLSFSPLQHVQQFEFFLISLNIFLQNILPFFSLFFVHCTIFLCFSLSVMLQYPIYFSSGKYMSKVLLPENGVIIPILLENHMEYIVQLLVLKRVCIFFNITRFS